MGNLKKLIVGLLAGSALLLGAAFSPTNQPMCVYAKKSATFQKNGHLWYRGKSSRYNVEVMPGTYSPTATQMYSFPKNKSKHYKLWTVTGMPVDPNRNPKKNVSSFMDETSSLLSDDMRDPSSGWGWYKFPKYVRNDMQVFTIANKGYNLARVAGEPLVYPLSVDNVNGRIVHVRTTDEFPDDATFIMPDDNTTPDSSNAKVLSVNLNLNSGISAASFAWYFGGYLKQGKLSIGDPLESNPSIRFGEESNQNDVTYHIDPNDHQHLSMTFKNTYDSLKTPGTHRIKMYFHPTDLYGENYVTSSDYSDSSFNLNLTEDPKTYMISRSQYESLMAQGENESGTPIVNP